MESFEYRNLEKVKEKPGIYAWYLDYNPSINPLDFQDFFSIKEFEVRMTGNFKENYIGTIESELKNESNSKKSQINQILLSNAVRAFNVPIYIGISETLRSRLRTHKDKLESKLAENSNSNSINFESIKIDTDIESSAFATRISKKLKKHNISASNLRVNVVYFDNTQQYNKQQLFLIENYLNRLFYPILGKN